MKAQLYIGDDLVSETVEIVSPPHEGDLIIFGERRLRIREIAHHIEKKKLQIVCHAPPKSMLEAVKEQIYGGDGDNADSDSTDLETE